ncbi:hypothetical protein [Penaeicola halotolerans]|uniref:hypothetical protein n=1 Tax=Penaeicola halotolerans TaxID=2793196 RepID=UPI001CF92693|nr:hypothetical protein [Penaeicola halotolerans]
MKLIDRFLKAKHWQLFIPLFGIPIIFQFYMTSMIFASINQTQPDPSVVFSIMGFFPIVMLLVMGVLFTWIWSVGIGLQDKIPSTVKMKTKKFKIFFFIPVGYLLMFILGMTVFFSNMPSLLEHTDPTDFSLIFSLWIIIFPLHFFAIFCIFYCMYFVAKTLKTVELQRATTFSDFVGEFFLIWFYAIGVWILQPKINKMVENQPQ